MATDRQRRVVLGVLAVVLGLVLYRGWVAGTATLAPSSTSNARARATRAAPNTGPPATAPDVHLQALDAERPILGSAERNLFRFRQRLAPTPPSGEQPPPAVRPVTSAPPGPPAPAPIPLKFIGIVEAPTQSKRIAALVDSMGRAYQGGEGDIVAGQYRVLKIGVESIEMSYLDGRGRQTIRLSGS